jgi:hypothetical protein
MDNGTILCIAPLAWLIVGTVGAIVGHIAKGQAGKGLALGFLLGPIGLLIILAGIDDRRTLCPACRSRVPSDATKCRYCQSELTPRPRRPAGVWDRDLLAAAAPADGKAKQPDPPHARPRGKHVGKAVHCPDCNTEAMATTEMGERVYVCPRCAAVLGSP